MSRSRTFTPKEIAAAIGSSESSVKRWIDQGRLHAAKTAGGHRRVPLVEVVKFLRDAGHALVDPEALGLTAADGLDLADPGAVRAAYLAALETGDERTTTGLVTHLHLLDRRTADVCDDPIRLAYQTIRSRCDHPSDECVVLHRGFADTLRALQRLRQLTDVPPPDAPAALLGDVGYEIDGLPTHLAELVLTSLGVRCTQLGVNVPDEVLFGAIDRLSPAFLWLSAGGGEQANRPAVRATVAEAVRMCAARGVRVVLCGDALPPRSELDRLDGAEPTLVRSMAELAAFTAGVVGHATAP